MASEQAPGAAREENEVDDEVPRQEAEQRWRQQLDPLVAAEPVGGEAGDEREQRQCPGDLWPPGHGSQETLDLPVAPAQAFDSQRRAAGDEDVGGGLLALDLGGGPRRPGAILFAPRRSRRSCRNRRHFTLDGSDQNCLAGGSLVHASSLPLLPLMAR